MNGHCFDQSSACHGDGISRRAARSALIVFLIVMVGVAAPLAGATHKGHKGQSLRKTFSNPEIIDIPDLSVANPYPSTIEVSGFKKAKITDVDLELNGYNHAYPDDVDVLLVAPDGRNAIVMSDVGGGKGINITITLDDQDEAPFPDNTALASGIYQPANYGTGDAFPGAPTPSGAVALATFNGSDPNGAWRLFIVDDAAGQTGSVYGWSLSITAKSGQNTHHKHHKHHKH